MMKRIHVVAAIIYVNQQVLLSLRAVDAHQGGRWEFPGGKIEQGETWQQALSRELYEELGISVTEAEHFDTVVFDYPDKHVQLEFAIVSRYQGVERGCEGQELSWCQPESLRDLQFPDANQSVLNKFLERLGV